MRLPNSFITAVTANGMAPRWKGRQVPCAIISPSARNSAVEKSSASLTTKERAVRETVSAISSASAASEFLISSSANGSRTPDMAACAASPCDECA